MLGNLDFILQQNLFQDILNTIHNGIVLVDDKKNVLYANKATGKIFGINSDLIPNTPQKAALGNFLRCKHDCLNCAGCSLDWSLKNFVKFVPDEKVVGEDFEFISDKGESKYLRYSIVPVLRADRREFFIIFEDLTEQKSLYRELELRHFRLETLTESLENADAIVMAVANSVEAKDKLTKGHISRVSYYAEKIGEGFKMTPKEIQILKKGAILHDIGKIGTPDYILNKPAKLTDEEFEIMKKHPIDGWKILTSMKSFTDIAQIVRHHHEKLDGSGYPDGISGNEIDIFTRIVAIVDIYDALTAKRPYRDSLSREVALDIIEQDVRAAKLDAEVVRVLSDVSKTATLKLEI